VLETALTERTEALGDEIPVPKAIRDITDHEDRRLARYFFVFFSRMEYALKQTGYLTEDAAPNWEGFASKHKRQFERERWPAIEPSIKYFTATPPKKQEAVGSRLQWSEPLWRRGHSLLPWLVVVIRQVRNNLFHGGKFSVPMPDPSRDRELLRHSLIILNAVLKLNEGVNHMFFQDLNDLREAPDE
jgi:hypothetical protein